ncbi:MAG: MarR family transcriptional regulator [Candidatus Aminicenantes bacterium]|nr:MarR family transcriptional regulator [Candidatus Aminicenantes bacterium]
MEIKKIRNFRKILRNFERLTSIQLKSCCSRVSLAQCHVLLEIEELDEATTGQLAQRLGLDKSTLSRTIDSLVNMGLLERLPSPSDRRFTPVVLTKQGKAVCNAINHEADDYYDRVFNSIPQGKHEVLIRDLSLLVQAMSAEEESRVADSKC